MPRRSHCALLAVTERYRTQAATLARAKRLRRDMTEAEKKLWYRIRADQLEGHSFRKQVPCGRYVLDFCCLRKGLVVEVDGSQHAEISEAEARRVRFLRKEGYRVIRYWNNEVLENIEGVLQEILRVLREMPDRF
jgi:very-short-patch-repair endonuclease